MKFYFILKTVPHRFINYCIVFEGFSVRILSASEIRHDLSFTEIEL